MGATTTSASPRAPATHLVYSLSVVSGVKIDCIHRLWLACRKTAGHTLPVFSRSQPCAKLIATAPNVNVSSQNQAGSPTPACTTDVIGWCQAAQMIPDTSATPVNGSTFASSGTMNPRQPSSSPVAAATPNTMPTVPCTKSVFGNPPKPSVQTLSGATGQYAIGMR